MNWFERHLHWTLALSCLATTAATMLVGAFSPYAIRPWPIVVIGYALPLIPCAWVLRRKAQTLWWLPVIWIPFMWWIYAVLYLWPSIPFIGWVIPLILPNRLQPNPHSSGREEAPVKVADHFAEQKTVPDQAEGLSLAVRVTGILTGLAVTGCGILMVKDMIGQVSAYFHVVEQVAYPLAVALSLFLTASLLIIPQRSYRVKPFVRSLAQFMAVCLLIGGVLAVLGGLFLGLVLEAADPGHGALLIGAAIVSGGILGLTSGGVLWHRVRASRRNSTGFSPPGSSLATRRASR